MSCADLVGIRQDISRMGPTEGMCSKSPLMTLPNELFIEVASHLDSFKDLNSLARTSRFFHTMFNTHLYRRAVAADDIVLGYIVGWVLSRYRLASLTLLLDNGLSVDRTCQFSHYTDDKTMLHFLCGLHDQERSVPMAQLLIQRGADIELKDICCSDTVLSEAIYHNKCEMVALLLANGADCKAVNRCGDTPLHCAGICAWDNAEMVHLLIAHGADIEARTVNGSTPLNAILFYKPRVMAALLEHGADVTVHNNSGQTPLHKASRWLDSQHAKALLERGAIVNATDISGRTPLHWVLEFKPDGHLFMAKCLLENGADVNAVSNHGLSPLQCALDYLRGADVVALLLEHGADASVLNENQRRGLSRIM
jgi:ankyrin repeat protein